MIITQTITFLTIEFYRKLLNVTGVTIGCAEIMPIATISKAIANKTKNTAENYGDHRRWNEHPEKTEGYAP